jgi:hypothetical protein
MAENCQHCGLPRPALRVPDAERGAALPDVAAELRAALRGELFQEIDLLAFALEMECAEDVLAGRDDAAARAQQARLGVRLAQRLVSGIPAPEVEQRLARWRAEYRARFPG